MESLENSNSEFPPLSAALGNPAKDAGFPHSHSADGGFYIDTTFKLLPRKVNLSHFAAITRANGGLFSSGDEDEKEGVIKIKSGILSNE